jgi:hypothetical protein
MVGQAFTFNGTNSYIQIPDSPVLRPTNLTIEAWVRFDSLDTLTLGDRPPGDQYIVFKQNSRTGDFEGYDLSKTRVGSTDVFRFLVTSSAGVEAMVLSATPISTSVVSCGGRSRANFHPDLRQWTIERQTNVSFLKTTAHCRFSERQVNPYWDHKLGARLMKCRYATARFLQMK